MNFKRTIADNKQPETSNEKKYSTADKVKLSVMGVILTAVVCQVAGFNVIGAVKGLSAAEASTDDAYAKLGQVTGSAALSSAPTVTAIAALPSVKTPAPEQTKPDAVIQKVPTKKEASIADEKNVSPDFVVAPDYRTLLAQIQIMENAINPEVEQQWVNMRLQLNAERERNRIAQVRLSRSKADAETAEFKMKTRELLDKIEAASSPVASVSNTNMDIALLSVNSDYVDIVLNGRAYNYKGLNSLVGQFKIANIDAKKGCASLKDKSDTITQICI